MQPFGYNRNKPKIGEGALPPFWEGRAGSSSNKKSPGLRPSSIPSGILILAAIWPQHIGAENWVGMCPFGGGELGPHLTQCGQGRVLPACQVSSWSVQPFGHSARTSQTDRQDRQDRTDRQRSDSIWRTVLQTVAQKTLLLCWKIAVWNKHVMTTGDWHNSNVNFKVLPFPIHYMPPRSDLITLEAEMSVRPYVRPSTKGTKRLSDFNEIWCTYRGRWVIHDGIPCDPIQGQGRGHGASEVLKIALFQLYLLCHLQLELANNHWLLN